MKALLAKEFRLTMSPWFLLVFLPLGLLLIPMWVFPLAMAYVFVGVMIVVWRDRKDHDLEFLATLPVSFVAQAKARAWTIVLLELTYLVVGMALSVVRFFLYPVGNYASMNTNLAFFGITLIMYATFNLIFLPAYYSRPYRTWWPLGGGTLIALLVGLGLTTLVAVLPELSLLNDRGFGNLGPQLGVFAGGAVIFILLSWLATNQAAKNIQKTQL
jgi:hypothetical protein